MGVTDGAINFAAWTSWEEESDYWRALDDDNWNLIVKACHKKTPHSYKSKNEKAFEKFVNRPIDYGDF